MKVIYGKTAIPLEKISRSLEKVYTFYSKEQQVGDAERLVEQFKEQTETKQDKETRGTLQQQL